MKIIYNMLSFMSISVPKAIYSLLSLTFTLKLNFFSLFLLVLFVLVGFYLFHRHVLSTQYSRLPNQETNDYVSNTFDLKPDSFLIEQDDNTNNGQFNPFPGEFLISFLSSIKIFQYLEEPIFKEFSRYLNTKKVLANETLFDNEEQLENSFYMVMDGHMQVFANNNNSNRLNNGAELNNAYHYANYKEPLLLTEVKNGGALSSLFTLLTLFSENVDLQNEADSNSVEFKHFLRNLEVYNRNYTNDSNTPVENQEERSIVPIDNFLVNDNYAYSIHHPNITAKAVVDTTLAVIPGEAFTKVTKKFPNASAHIVQVILTRFQRVTCLTLDKYLGLGDELLTLERKLTKLANYSTSNNAAFDKEFVKKAITKCHLEYVNKDPKNFYSTSNKLSNPISEINNRNYSTLKLKKPSQKLKQDIFHLSESMFEKEELECFYKLRAAAFSCVSKSIGIRSKKNVSIVNQAGDLSRNMNRGLSVSQTQTNREIYRTNNSFVTFSDNRDLDTELEMFYAKTGTVLARKGERVGGIYIVISGSINVVMEENDSSSKFTNSNIESNNLENESSLFTVYPGGLAAYLSSLSGSPSFVKMYASADTLLGFVSRQVLEQLSEKYPDILLTLAKRLVYQISPLSNIQLILVTYVDFGLEWIQASSSQILCRQGKMLESIYIVLNGRLRTIKDQKGSTQFDILGEFGQGESIGELEVLSIIITIIINLADLYCPYTLYAIRDSEVARIPKTLFSTMSHINPNVAIYISKMIAHRTKRQLELMNKINNNNLEAMTSLPKNNSRLKTIGILPVNKETLIHEFARRLRDSFHGIGESALLLNNSKIVAQLGKHAFTRFGKLKLNTWLVEQEEKVSFILYVADSNPHSLWTQKCLRQSDCILLIANAGGDPKITEFERLLIAIKTTARKELVLLHKHRWCKSGLTSIWLKNRTWIQAHHHVHYDALNRKDNTQVMLYKNTLDHIKDHLKSYLTYKTYYHQRQSRVYLGNRSDFSRLARRLSGKSIGVVLGGGGARGIGHVGFIRALEEAGVPIDIVGGTSIGSFVGGLFAKDSDTVAIYGRIKMFSSRMSAKWRLISDLTYPIISWFSGHQFNRALWKCFGDTRIEDLWLPYYCVTTNITHSRMEVHHSGYLWRYVRASMGLSGFLPPLCDNGNLLVDGGYVNFLPVNIMKSMGTNTIFALDVSANNEYAQVHYGDTVSGFWVLLNRLNPLSTYSKIPTLDEIQSRIMFVSGVKQLKESKNTPGCYYVRLPIENYKTLDFDKFEQIYRAGYKEGVDRIKKWREEGLLKKWTQYFVSEKERQKVKITRRNSM